MKRSSGVLLLSHCGFSFMEDLIDLVKQSRRECYVLSSKPSQEHPERIAQLSMLADYIEVSEGHDLTLDDLKNILQTLREKNKTVEVCLSVWEGYRYFMALVNHHLGMADLNEATILKITDKYALRQELKKQQLSDIHAEILTPELLETLKIKPDKKFIKPCTGLASYGAFCLKESTTWEALEKIQCEASNDLEYSGLLHANDIHFIVEDYIEGIEYSFEIIAVDGKPHVMAIHEKVDIQEKENTVHECACISPPMSLSQAEIKQSVEWINMIFQKLALSWGCFHVEAKCHHGHWEIIEINPRVGGAYISHSVAILTGGENLLSFWLKSLLLQKESSAKTLFLKQLYHQSSEGKGFFNRKNSTFFRVYFAEPGKKIRQINVSDEEPKPANQKIFLETGKITPMASRELFLAQALWKIPREKNHQIIPLIKTSLHTIEAIYE